MNSRLQLYPLPRIGVALVLGIVFGDFFHAYLPTFLWLLCTLVGLLIYFLSRRKPLLQSGILLGCVFLLGSWLINVRENRLEFIDTQKETTYQAVVVSKPIIRGKVAMFDMLVIDNHHPIKIRTSMMWDSSRNKHLLPEIGSGLLVQSRIKPFVQKDSLSHFNVVRWAQVQGYRGQTFIDDEKRHYSVVSLSTLSLLQRARLSAMKWRNLLVKSLPIQADDSSNIAIVAAMTLGDKSGLSQATKQLFSITGSSHVLALSGLHLGILYAILMFAFSRRKKRIWTQMIVILAIWTYVLLTGLPTSLIRAATMFTILGLVSLAHRSAYTINSLSLAAIIMLVANPMLLWDIGFQLSFSAVFAIMLFFQWLKNWGFNPHTVLQKAFAAFVLLPIAAQLGTFPLVLYHFGLFSGCFLLSNLIVVPAAMLIIFGTLLSFVLWFIPFLRSFVFMAMGEIVRWLQISLSFVASIPYSSVSGIRISELQVILIYLLIISILGIVHHLLKAIDNRRKLKTICLGHVNISFR